MSVGLCMQYYDLEHMHFILLTSCSKAIHVIFSENNTVIDLYLSENVKFRV